ncbi:hypothetical protein BHE74_00001999 [Ensete ventricosum]|nr:hypothetical protein BHE74_00001999 [Ensete ventricosum]
MANLCLLGALLETGPPPPPPPPPSSFLASRTRGVSLPSSSFLCWLVYSPFTVAWRALSLPFVICLVVVESRIFEVAFPLLAGLISLPSIWIRLLPVSPQRVFLLIAESVERWISLLKCCRRVYCVDTAREDHTSVPSTFSSESTLFFWLRKNDSRAKVTAKSLVQKDSPTAKAAKGQLALSGSIYSVSPQRVLLLLAESVERLISLLRCCRRVDTTREDHVSVPSISSSEYDVFR